MIEQNYINHIALVLDSSYSMSNRAEQVIKVADNQIAYLAQRSQELDQETRITVYKFSDSVECIIYDKDVLRLPSIDKFYRAKGMTALIDAAIKSQIDLSKTAELYGDHAFLTYILTDGMENVSQHKPRELKTLLENQPDHWTIAVMVPDQRGVFEAKKFGFSPNNIAIWDTNSSAGINEAGSTIRRTTDNFMQQRSTGVRGSKNIFNMGIENLNSKTVKSNLDVLYKSKYAIYEIFENCPISDFVKSRLGINYKIGTAYYQLSKPEDIQPQKQICIMDKRTRKIFWGSEARNILGLPDSKVRVRPSVNPQYDVFVQSTSVNRKLIRGTKLIVMV